MSKQPDSPWEAEQELLGLGALGLGCQSVLSQPIPGAMLTWEGTHFMRAVFFVGCWPTCAQVHSCALLFLRQSAVWCRGGIVSWEEGKLG